MVLGVVMNRLLYVLSMHFGLPFWLDMSGTILAALLLEPTAGLLVGLVNNFGLAVFNYSSSSLIFYAVSAAAALVVGVNMRRNGQIDWKQTVPTMGLLILVTGVLSALLSIWQTGGTLTHPWEVYFYDLAISAGVPWVLAFSRRSSSFARPISSINPAVTTPAGIAITAIPKSDEIMLIKRPTSVTG